MITDFDGLAFDLGPIVCGTRVYPKGGCVRLGVELISRANTTDPSSLQHDLFALQARLGY